MRTVSCVGTVSCVVRVPCRVPRRVFFAVFKRLTLLVFVRWRPMVRRMAPRGLPGAGRPGYLSAATAGHVVADGR